MTEDLRDKAPSAEEIERKFRSWHVLATRPLLWGGIETLKVVRGFHWVSHFEHDLSSVEGPLIFAANHRSHADTAAILGTLPARVCKRTVVAAALDVFGPDNHGGIRRKISKDCLQFIVASGFHAFAFDRLGPPLRSVRTSVQLIRNGWNLLLYPEGTRNRNGEIASFKPGVALLAKFTDRPVIPIHVEGGDAILPCGVFMPQPARAFVRYGEPLRYRADDTPVTFTDRLEQAVRQLGQRQPMIVRPAPVTGRFSRWFARPRPQTAGAQHPY
jgi:1-acyl-sn-glycerol-3-phosphate acyltransferase